MYPLIIDSTYLKYSNIFHKKTTQHSDILSIYKISKLNITLFSNPIYKLDNWSINLSA